MRERIFLNGHDFAYINRVVWAPDLALVSGDFGAIAVDYFKHDLTRLPSKEHLTWQ